jgi:hypothetical protein
MSTTDASTRAPWGPGSGIQADLHREFVAIGASSIEHPAGTHRARLGPLGVLVAQRHMELP